MLFENKAAGLQQPSDGQINVTALLQWLKTDYSSSGVVVDCCSFDWQETVLVQRHVWVGSPWVTCIRLVAHTPQLLMSFPHCTPLLWYQSSLSGLFLESGFYTERERTWKKNCSLLGFTGFRLREVAAVLIKILLFNKSNTFLNSFGFSLNICYVDSQNPMDVWGEAAAASFSIL